MIDRRFFLGGLLGSIAVCGARASPVVATPAAFREPRGPEIWVSNDGKNSNPGTFTRPLLTLEEAISRPEPVVQCLPGSYLPFNLVERTKIFAAPFGGVTIETPGPDIATMSFLRSNEPDTYIVHLPRSVEPRLLLRRMSSDGFGFDCRLRKGIDWNYDKIRSQIYVRLTRYSERLALYALFVQPQNRSSMIVNTGGTLGIRGINIRGVGITSRPSKNSQPTSIFRGCESAFAYGAAFQCLGGSSFAENVRVHASDADSFSYSQSDDGKPARAIERNCHVSCAGDIDANGAGDRYPNLNASSSHGSFIVRHGGIYEHSYGPDIADTANTGVKAISINRGVKVRSSYIGVGFLFDGGDANGGDRIAYLDRCVAEGQKIDLEVLSGASVFEHDCTLPHRHVINGAVNTITLDKIPDAFEEH